MRLYEVIFERSISAHNHSGAIFISEIGPPRGSVSEYRTVVPINHAPHVKDINTLINLFDYSFKKYNLSRYWHFRYINTIDVFYIPNSYYGRAITA